MTQHNFSSEPGVSSAELQARSSRLYKLCQEIAQDESAQIDKKTSERMEAYWIASTLSWEQMHTGETRLQETAGKLWRYKTREPWTVLQETLAFAASAPVLGVDPTDRRALLSDDPQRARIMPVFAVPVLLSFAPVGSHPEDRAKHKTHWAELSAQCAKALGSPFAKALGQEGVDGVVFNALLSPEKLRRLELDRGGLSAFLSALAGGETAVQARENFGPALSLVRSSQSLAAPELAWVIVGLWPQNAQTSQANWRRTSGLLGPGCLPNLSETVEQASQALNQVLEQGIESSADRPEFAVFPPMPLGFALQTQEALSLTLSAAASLSARSMQKAGAQSVGWMGDADEEKSDELAWKKGSVWALGTGGAPLEWNPSFWMGSMHGRTEIEEGERTNIERAFSLEGLTWRANARMSRKEAQQFQAPSGSSNTSQEQQLEVLNTATAGGWGAVQKIVSQEHPKS